MAQDQTVHEAENVSSLWQRKYTCIAVVFRHHRSFPEISGLPGFPPAILEIFREFLSLSHLQAGIDFLPGLMKNTTWSLEKCSGQNK
jgi:hypothetical protein